MPDGSTAEVTTYAKLELLTDELPDGHEGDSYQATLGAAGGDGTSFSWSVLSGPLPAGVSLSTDGVLSGTPTQAGTFPFKAIGTFSDMSMADITESTQWFTGNSDVAKFDYSLNQKFGPGLARLKGSGVTSVTVGGTGAYSGVVALTQLTVSNANPTQVVITGPNTVQVGKSIQLTATATFDDMSMHDVTIVSGWSFDNPSVSVITGQVNGLIADGMATVTATLGNVSDTHVVNVTPQP